MTITLPPATNGKTSPHSRNNGHEAPEAKPAPVLPFDLAALGHSVLATGKPLAKFNIPEDAV